MQGGFAQVEGGLKIYAIIETGGKQYKVTSGQVIDVDRLDVADGDIVELEKVLLVADDDRITVGTPTVDGAKVIATARGEGRAKKIVVFRYKPKRRYRKKTGHRQFYTSLAIGEIIGAGATPDKPAKRVRRSKKEVIESGA